MCVFQKKHSIVCVRVYQYNLYFWDIQIMKYLMQYRYMRKVSKRHEKEQNKNMHELQ